MFRNYWARIWYRQEIDLPRAKGHITKGWEGRTHPKEEWEDCPPGAWYTAAKKLRGGAGGADGWHGNEIADIPEEAWQDLGKLLCAMRAARKVPEQWRQGRQVHIGKAGKASKDGTYGAGDMRPITILSAWWRMFAGARLNSHATHEWVQKWAPAGAHGGLAGREVFTALAEMDKMKAIASLDFAKAFDLAHPALALHALRLAGLPDDWHEIISFMWQGHSRFIHINNFCDPVAAKVSQSLPQGCPWSPLGLIAFLAGPAWMVERSVEGVSQTLFLDDRTIGSDSPMTTMQGVSEWKRHSIILGMKEHEGKTQFLAGKWGAEWVAAGAPPEQIKPTIQALGFSISSEAKRKPTEEEESRIHKAMTRAWRVRILPGSVLWRQRVAAAAVLPVAIYGWGFKVPPKKLVGKLSTMLRHIGARKVNSCASRDLLPLVQGHNSSFYYRWGQDQVMGIWRAASKRKIELPPWNTKGGRAGPVRAWMKDQGFREEGPWKWRHAQAGEVDIHRPYHRGEKAAKHTLREAWRRKCFAGFWASSRRDSSEVIARGQRTWYEEKGVAKARKWARGNLHMSMVLAGAGVSPQLLHVMDREAKKKQGANPPELQIACTHCGVAPADWAHCTWGCSAHPPPVERPRSVLQARMGWPVSGDNTYDRKVLAHLAKVRERTLDDRYRGGRTHSAWGRASQEQGG